ncbi:MAG: hypothetical protein JWN22_738 [Nocardioides sp.]|jgi:hypothetical protein|nr:hypothetical protein [Nocardioides sp.]
MRRDLSAFCCTHVWDSPKDGMTSVMNRLGNSHGRRAAARGFVSAAIGTLLLATVISGSTANADESGEGSEPVASRATYTVPGGALFGRPEGSGHTNAIRNRLVDMIDATPKGAYIRAVTWSYTSDELTDRLIAAHQRGVTVRVLASGSAADDYNFRRLQTALRDDSGDAPDNGWAKAVKNASRGPDTFDGVATSLHQKSWTFSTSGVSRRVVVVTSANITDEASDHQWTDAFTWIDPDNDDAHNSSDLYETMVNTFEEQEKDNGGANPFLEKEFSDSFSATFSPWDSPAMADPVVARIRALPADGLSIRIANSAWRGPRGEAIARVLATKAGNGAKIWVLASQPFGASVKNILVGAGIKWADGFASDNDYHHFKFMTARYTQDGAVKTRVWAGSENWSDDSRGNDELVIKVGAAGVHNDYVDAFDTAVSSFGGWKD